MSWMDFRLLDEYEVEGFFEDDVYDAMGMWCDDSIWRVQGMHNLDPKLTLQLLKPIDLYLFYKQLQLRTSIIYD